MEYRSAQFGPETTHPNSYDAANRLRYALRLGVRGDLTDDFYYGIRLETSPNERSTWNSFGNASGGQSPTTILSARPTTTPCSSGWLTWVGIPPLGSMSPSAGCRSLSIPRQWCGIRTIPPKERWKK